jgi:hypothetical protein
MRALRLARLAARAEVLLLQRRAVVLARRAAFAVAALLFGGFALVALHVIAALALLDYALLPPLQVALLMLAGDTAIALVFVLLAVSQRADASAREAERLREACLGEIKTDFLVAAFVSLVLKR